MDGNSVTARDYLRVLRRRKAIVIAMVLFFIAGALVYTSTQSKLYAASAKVALNAQPSLPGVFEQKSNSGPAAPRFNSTQAVLAASEEVAKLTLRKARVEGMTPQQLLAASDVAPSPAADILTFTVRNADPDVAARLAQAYARSFTEYRSDVTRRGAQTRADQLQEELDDLQAQLRTASGEEAKLLRRRAQEANQDLATLRTFVVFLDEDAVVTSVGQDARQVQPQPERDLFLATGLGLVLGIIAAFVFEAVSSRVRSPVEVASSLDLAVLAQLPRPPRRLARHHRLVMIEDAMSPAAEAFRFLRARLELANRGGARRILVTSATREEGKSTTAANLAVGFAQSGRRAALVDLDLHNPTVHKFFDVGHTPGITDVVRGRVPLDEALHSVNVVPNMNGDVPGAAHPGEPPEELAILPLGSGVDDSSRFLLSPELGSVLANLARRYDVVIIDTAPLLLVSHATILASRVDGLLAVARVDALSRSLLISLQEAIESLPVSKLGVVLTDAKEAPVQYGYPVRPVTEVTPLSGVGRARGE